MSLTPGFDDLFIDFILAIPDDQIVGLPDNVTMQQLVARFPEIYEQLRQKAMAQQTAANTCDDAVQTPKFGRK